MAAKPCQYTGTANEKGTEVAEKQQLCLNLGKISDARFPILAICLKFQAKREG